MDRDPAPGRPSGRSGALLSALLVAPIGLLGLLGGCDALGGGARLALDSTAVSIAGSVHDVRIDGAGATDSIVPDRIEVEPGDAVRFIVADRRPHALAFTVDALAAPVREYLDRTGQLRGPPLVNEGAAWVVVLDDAPPGRYPFHCRSHDAGGELILSRDD